MAKKTELTSQIQTINAPSYVLIVTIMSNLKVLRTLHA